MQHLKNHRSMYLLIITVLVWTNLYFTTVKIGKEYFGVKTKVTQQIIKPVLAEKPDQKEPTDMKEWVLWKVKQEGLNVEAVECLIDHESGWRPFAYYINRGGTSLDRGLWMWNDKWNARITNECAFDYKCATVAAIGKIKRDGNMNAWYGYLNNCK